ncbi:MAG: YhgE/Pip domain-containing protein [Methanobrevibacter sp.]|nr:YhgE/Pip domain-containing protein [Methanobrevibacter sp.]
MSGRDINNIVEIVKKDFKAAFSNPIVMIVLVGIIVLPSLYALINIDACWDPYEETGDIQFAIANLDEGATYNDMDINIGNELVKELKKNDDFDWTFVSEDELRDGVYYGKYYAGIVIPKNLSEEVISITGDDPKQAELEYVVNIKSNPVASKLTDSAANAVYTTLNAKIVQIINLAAYGKLGELQSGLASGASQLSSGGSQLAAGSQKISSGASDVSDGVSQVQDGASQVQSGASQVQSGANSVKQGSTSVKNGASQVEKGSEEIQAAVDPSVLPEPIKTYVQSNIKLANASGEVAKGSSSLADGSVKLANSSSKLASGSSDVASGSVQLAEGSLSLAAGSQLLSNSATQALFSASSALSSSANSLSAITGINETILGDYFLAPVKLEKHELFPVPNYGSNVAPFYLVLSMWVGALITCTMLKPGNSEGTKYSSFEMYFGKLILFVFMSILQVAITIAGSFILGIYIANPILFILSAVLVSVVFMVLMYSLVSALGNVGKAVSIVLLVLQISGTGGIYPVEIMRQFFQVINPYLPMTYAITLIREAQLGLVWIRFIPALVVLVAIGIITVIVMLIVKEKADKRAHYFEKRLEDSGLF